MVPQSVNPYWMRAREGKAIANCLTEHVRTLMAPSILFSTGFGRSEIKVFVLASMNSFAIAAVYTRIRMIKTHCYNNSLCAGWFFTVCSGAALHSNYNRCSWQ